MRLIFFIFTIVFFIACGENGDVNQFKTGTFKTHLDGTDVNSVAYRNDSMQIETYNNIKYTYRIKWNSNFEYELTKINPETQLDSTPFIIKITGIKDNSYSFSAHYKGSNFKQKGTAFKSSEDE